MHKFMKSILIIVLCINHTALMIANESQVVRHKSIDDSGLASEVKNLMLGQTIKGRAEIFANDVAEINYYAIFADLTNLNLFQTKSYVVEWIDPAGQIYFSDKVALAPGNNKLVYSKLNIKNTQVGEKVGTWKCRFYKKDVLYDEKQFLLEFTGAKENRLGELKRTQELKNADESRKAEELARVNDAKTKEDVEHPKNIIEPPNDLNRAASIAEPTGVGGQLADWHKDVDIRDRSTFILEPLLVYENAYTEQRIISVDESIKNILSKEAISRATDVLSYCGGKVRTISSITDSDKAMIGQSYNKLQDSSEDLVKQWKDKNGYSNDFALLRGVAKCDFVLVHFVKVKVGAVGGWDFVATGTVVPETSTTTIKTALIDINSAKILWSGSSIERSMPQKHVLAKCLKTLYVNFPGYSKK